MDAEKKKMVEMLEVAQQLEEIQMFPTGNNSEKKHLPSFQIASMFPFFLVT